MPTVAEAIESLSKLKYRKAILEYIISNIDEEFLNPGHDPSRNMVLLTDDKIVVPAEEIEAFVTILSEMQKKNGSAINEVLNQQIHNKTTIKED